VTRSGKVGLIGFVLILIACLVGPLILGDPNKTNLSAAFAGPSASYPLGADGVGRDILTRTLAGGRMDILIAVVASLISFSIGTVLGVAIGYSRGHWTDVAMRALDVLQAFPLLIFAMLLVAFLSHTWTTLVLAIGVAMIPIFIRLTHRETLALRDEPFIDAARCVGNPTWRVLGRHVLPNVITSSLVHLTTTMGAAIIVVGALSFVGVGVQPPTAEWGAMVKEGAEYVATGQWWMALVPGVAVALTVLCLHLIGEGLITSRGVR
jgi:peptide/nickel transport system permease protein